MRARKRASLQLARPDTSTKESDLILQDNYAERIA